MLRAKVGLARVAGALSRASRRGGGTSFPGKLLLRMEPRAVGLLSQKLERGSVVVSATNGKTTTSGMIARVLAEHGLTAVHNRAGANMKGGVATALLEQRGRIGLFEVDEAWLRDVVAELSPHTVLLSNLFRDQLDRYGELDMLADEWNELVAAREGDTAFVLNADDPMIADLGRNAAGNVRQGITYFGLEDRAHALERVEHASDAKHCRRCGTAYRYSAAYLGHLGDYRCPHCGNSRPQPQVSGRDVKLAGMAGSSFTLASPAGETRIALRVPGLYNVYNAVAAAACCLQIGASLDEIRRGLESFAPAFGRAEQIPVGDRRLAILLVKNPAGANEVFRTLAAADEDDDYGLDVWMVLNDRIADGRDVSWIWDADFETLAPHASRVVCSGTRAEELALRLKYAGVATAQLEVVPQLKRGLDRALEANGEPAAGRPLYALPTYTALLELRDVLTERGYAPPFWE